MCKGSTELFEVNYICSDGFITSDGNIFLSLW